MENSYRRADFECRLPPEVERGRFLFMKGSRDEWVKPVKEEGHVEGSPFHWRLEVPEGYFRKYGGFLVVSWPEGGEPYLDMEAEGVGMAPERPVIERRHVDLKCHLNFSVDRSSPPKTLLVRGDRERAEAVPDVGFDRWDGRTYRVEVPEGHFDKFGEPTGYVYLHWPEGGEPEMVGPCSTLPDFMEHGLGIDLRRPSKLLHFRGTRGNLEVVLKSEGWDWEVEVPDGYFCSPEGDVLAVRWKGGRPGLVGRNFADPTGCVVPEKEYSVTGMFDVVRALPFDVDPDNPPKRLFFCGTSRERVRVLKESEYRVGSPGFWSLEVPEGHFSPEKAGNRVMASLSWPEGWTPVLQDWDGVRIEVEEMRAGLMELELWGYRYRPMA